MHIWDIVWGILLSVVLLNVFGFLVFGLLIFGAWLRRSSPRPPKQRKTKND